MMMPKTELAELVVLNLLLMALSAANAQSLEGWASSKEVPLGGSLRLRCSAVGPSGLAVRLACPLLAKTAGSAATCFEDCQRSPKAATVPELQTAARCELRRRQVAAPGSSMGDYGWSEVTIEYEFSDFSQRYDGNYTCKFMLLRAVSTVKVALPATESSKTSAAYATTPEPKNSKIYDSSDSAAVDVVRKSSTAAVSNSATGIAKKARPTEAPLGDWFRMEIYGPITLGHVIAVSLSVVTLLLVACLAAGLVSCYCRRIRRKQRRAEFTISMDGTGGWGASLPRGRQTPIGGFSTADIAAAAAASVSASATLQAGADSSWTSSPIYADVESSPLISGGGSAGHRQDAAFGSQGRGINGAAVAVGSSSGSFFNRDQLGRHSFHSVRQQHQVINRGATSSAAASPAIPRQNPLHSPPLSFAPSSDAVPVPILQLVAEQRVEIDRLSQQLRNSQRQLNQLVASHTDLHRCLSSRQLNSAVRHRHESGPQQLTNEYQQDPSQDRSIVGGVYGSTDALTVETIDEEFEADGTLKTPARKQQQQRQQLH